MERFHRVEVIGDVERLSNNFIRGIKDRAGRVYPI